MRAPTAFEVVLGIGLSGGAVYMLISYTQGNYLYCINDTSLIINLHN